jgi:hypothetical protein
MQRFSTFIKGGKLQKYGQCFRHIAADSTVLTAPTAATEYIDMILLFKTDSSLFSA